MLIFIIFILIIFFIFIYSILYVGSLCSRQEEESERKLYEKESDNK